MSANAFRYAEYPIDLQLPSGDRNDLIDVQEAVRQQYQQEQKWKIFETGEPSVVLDHVYELPLKHSIDSDWSWDGALCFAATTFDQMDKIGLTLMEDQELRDDIIDSIRWSADLLEVDKTGRKLYVESHEVQFPPTEGFFYIRPFVYSKYLNEIYNHSTYATIQANLQDRLRATRGEVHPKVKKYFHVGTAEYQQLWKKSWSILWGPPGTGKTYTIGEQVAKTVQNPHERILVVSSTNKATDTVALQIGRAAKKHNFSYLSKRQILRIGKSAQFEAFRQEGLDVMLPSEVHDGLKQKTSLEKEKRYIRSSASRALLAQQLNKVRRDIPSVSSSIFIDDHVRVVVATQFKALMLLCDYEVQELLEQNKAPFTTIIIDEAGLVSRAKSAALSLLASRRVMLVGDPQQLSPISTMDSISASQQAAWFGYSALSHLHDTATTQSGVKVLSEQHRMPPKVCQILSEVFYSGKLKTSSAWQPTSLPEGVRGVSTAVWYHLNSRYSNLAKIRAERSGSSWQRSISQQVIEDILTLDGVSEVSGLFITPYRAQADLIRKRILLLGCKNWEASTVHSQQGAQADIVIFDVVKVTGRGWSRDEWRRLITVALSRTSAMVIVIASEEEMSQPFLMDIAKCLPRWIVQKNSWLKVDDIAIGLTKKETNTVLESKPNTHQRTLGQQIRLLHGMNAVPSMEQQKLINRKIGHGFHVVRGVAGSGKSLVLAHWVANLLKDSEANHEDTTEILIVYANKTLRQLLEYHVVEQCRSLGWVQQRHQNLKYMHIMDILAELQRSNDRDAFDLGADLLSS